MYVDKDRVDHLFGAAAAGTVVLSPESRRFSSLMSRWASCTAPRQPPPLSPHGTCRAQEGRRGRARAVRVHGVALRNQRDDMWVDLTGLSISVALESHARVCIECQSTLPHLLLGAVGHGHGDLPEGVGEDRRDDVHPPPAQTAAAAAAAATAATTATTATKQQ